MFARQRVLLLSQSRSGRRSAAKQKFRVRDHSSQAQLARSEDFSPSGSAPERSARPRTSALAFCADSRFLPEFVAAAFSGVPAISLVLFLFPRTPAHVLGARHWFSLPLLSTILPAVFASLRTQPVTSFSASPALPASGAPFPPSDAAFRLPLSLSVQRARVRS